MIPHPSSFADPPRHGDAILFASMVGFTCSICAPLAMTQAEVEAAATAMQPPRLGPWRAVDKSKPPISVGEPTPNPCSVYQGRQHWFLMST